MPQVRHRRATTNLFLKSMAKAYLGSIRRQTPSSSDTQTGRTCLSILSLARRHKAQVSLLTETVLGLAQLQPGPGDRPLVLKKTTKEYHTWNPLLLCRVEDEDAVQVADEEPRWILYTMTEHWVLGSGSRQLGITCHHKSLQNRPFLLCLPAKPEISWSDSW